MMRRVSEEEEAWLIANYAHGTIHDTLDGFEREFGWRPTEKTIYQRAHKMELRKERQDPAIRNGRAQTTIRWSCEPKMEAWMLEHDRGLRIEDTIAGFEREFGIRLSRGQVSLFRASHGTQKRASHKGGRPRKPVGTERATKGGILVKVAEEATVPQSKNNWRFKHHIAYEEAYGPIPEGCVVYAVDGDAANCDPENLVAVPKRAVGALNMSKRKWSSREELLAMAGIAMLDVSINDAEHGRELTCGVCGASFLEDTELRSHGKRVAQTCPACLARGRKAKGERKTEEAVCEKCGKPYSRWNKRQRLCSDCSTSRYQRKGKEATG